MAFKTKLTTLAIAATLAAAAGTASAVAFPDFTVDPDRNAGTANSFVADKITGNYVEVITFTPTSGSGGTFDFSLRFQAGQFVANDGSTPLFASATGLNNTGGYGLYALVTGSGTYSQSGGMTTFNTGPGGTLDLLLDRSADTTFTNDSSTATQANLFSRNNAGDDLSLLASGAAISGQGTLDPSLSTCGSGGGSGINCGSFGQTSSIQLNADGRSFFTQPVPFYNVAFNSGQLNNFDVSGTQVINGSLDVVFNRIPEPSSLALVGLALVGLGLRRRAR